MRKVNETLDKVTISDIENHKKVSMSDLIDDLNKLKEYDSSENRNTFYGNRFLYHHQMKNLLKCRRDTGETIYDIYDDKIKWDKLIEQTKKRNRGGNTGAGNIYECFRVNTGSIVMFKASTAKYLYQKYNARKVLDPTAGWGGRMLGAWALDIDYVGIDTNIEMMNAYSDMIGILNQHSGIYSPNIQMIWDNALDVDFSDIEYDFILTSPPYINMEVYEHMEEWNSEESFYKDFLIPLWDKSISNISKNGKVCLNISPKMYNNALKYGMTAATIEENLLQQLGQQKNKKRQDKIYIWSK